ncbi:MAG: hypothetical protein ACE5DS_06460 [Kiloniellaceae bacterium]
MYESSQRLSVVLEYRDDEEEWATVAMLIDERGGRRRATLARFPSRKDAAAALGDIFTELPRIPRRHG